MKGAYEFLVTVQPAPDDSSKLIIDARCVLMNTGKKGYLSKSSWICDAGSGPKMIQDSLVTACDWLNTCVEKEESQA